MFDYLLPIGSVVKINNAPRAVMIIGVLQQVGTESFYDYTAVTYPEGFIDPRLKIVFNHSDITEVCYRGYEDQSWHALMRKLEIAKNSMESK